MSLQSLIIITKLSEDFCFIFNNIINQIEYIKCNFFYFMFAIKSTNKKLYRGNKYINRIFEKLCYFRSLF